MKSSLRTIVFFAVVALLFGASSAFADTYQVTFAGSGVNGLLNLTASPNGVGTEIVTSVTGNVNGHSVLGIVAPTAASGYSSFTLPDGDIWAYDDVIYPTTSTFLDIYGLLFTVQGVSQPVNLFYNPPTIYGVYIGAGPFPTDFKDTPVSLTVTPTPEPSSLALLLAGTIAIAALLLARKATA